MSTLRRCRGLTLVELCIGIVITSVISCALAGFTLSVTRQWRAMDEQNALELSAQQSMQLIGPIIQSARGLGGVSSTYQPDIFLWQSDGYSDSDGQPQFSEMALIEYDASTQSIYYYQGDLPVAMNLVGSLTNIVLTSLQMQSADVMQFFKLQTAWLMPRRTLLGPGRTVTGDTPITRVESASFSAVDDTDLPAVRMNLTLVRGSERLQTSQVFSLRGTSKQ